MNGSLQVAGGTLEINLGIGSVVAGNVITGLACGVFALGISDWSIRFKKGKNNFVSDAIEKMMGEPN